MFEESTTQEERLDSDVTTRGPHDGDRGQLARDHSHDDGFVGTRLQSRRETTVGGLTAIGMHQLVKLGRSRERQSQQEPDGYRRDKRAAGGVSVAGFRRHHGFSTRSRVEEETATRRGAGPGKAQAPASIGAFGERSERADAVPPTKFCRGPDPPPAPAVSVEGAN